MHIHAINEETRNVLEKIRETDLLEEFYLAGGTALATQLGHRESIDLDFFSPTEFSLKILKEKLVAIGKLAVDYEEEGTLSGRLDEVKISFMKYGYEQVFPLLDFDGTKLADERDIAAMKIDAISSRGSKKDFVDIYFLLKKYSLEEIIGFFEKKFKGIEYNKLHILKSLSFFDDAEKDPMPRMIIDANWDDVKKRISEEVKKMIA